MSELEETTAGRIIQAKQPGWEKTAGELARRNTRLVVYIAKMFLGRGLPLQDLICAGNIGLLKAARRFRADRNTRFVTYAVWWIRQACRREIANHSCTIRVPSYIYENRMHNGRTHASARSFRAASAAWRTGPIERAVFHTPSVENVLATVVEHERDRRLRRAIDDLHHLDQRLPDILRRRFGFEPYRDEQTYEEIAQSAGVSKQRVQQITIRGLAVLRLSLSEGNP